VLSITICPSPSNILNPTHQNRAMRDANLPKFLAHDVILFCSIINDLFPGLTVPGQDHGELERAVRGALAASGMQQPASFVNKVLQLYDTFNVRFGVMLVSAGWLGTCWVDGFVGWVDG